MVEGDDDTFFRPNQVTHPVYFSCFLSYLCVIYCILGFALASRCGSLWYLRGVRTGG